MCDTQICTSRYGGFRQVMGTPSHHPAPQRPPTGIPRELDDTDMSGPGLNQRLGDDAGKFPAN